MSAISIDLNADLGEGFPRDRELLNRISSASVCCGAHAGDDATIRETLGSARDRGVVVGAHPGYPDREGFGRREQCLAPRAIRGLILDQTGHLEQLAAMEGITIRFLKPHGALYNQSQRDPDLASAVAEAAFSLDLPVLGLPGSALEREARRHGVRFVSEGFLDRRYDIDGHLVLRTRIDAILTNQEEVEVQALRLAKGSAVASLCLHGDDPRAVERADGILAAFREGGIVVRSFLATDQRP